MTEDLDALMREVAPPERDDAFILATIERMEREHHRQGWLPRLTQPAGIAAGALGAWAALQLLTSERGLALSIDFSGPALMVGVVMLSMIVARQMLGAFGR